MTHQLIYASRATQPMSDDDLVALLQQCRSNNAALDVTGMLLYDGGKFIQVLEGDSDTISNLFRRIKEDERNADLVMIDNSAIDQRTFGAWSMGFRRVDANDRQALAGYTDILDAPYAPAVYQDNADRIGELLRHYLDAL